MTDLELRALWGALDQVGYPFGPLLQLLAVTGQRRSEVAAMRWADIDLDQAIWRIPASRNKAKRSHTVPLSALALEIIKSISRFDGSEYLFTVTGNTPVSGFSKVKRRIDAMSGVKDWRIHDLRRTAATGMVRLGTEVSVLSKVLNHADAAAVSGVTAIYNRYGYDREKRAALEAWARQLERIARVPQHHRRDPDTAMPNSEINGSAPSVRPLKNREPEQPFQDWGHTNESHPGRSISARVPKKLVPLSDNHFHPPEQHGLSSRWVKLGPKRVAWVLSEIEAWIKEYAAEGGILVDPDIDASGGSSGLVGR